MYDMKFIVTITITQTTDEDNSKGRQEYDNPQCHKGIEDDE